MYTLHLLKVVAPSLKMDRFEYSKVLELKLTI